MSDKIQDRESMARIAREAREAGRTVVFTNGCFDILHAGHAAYLGEARALGDLLVVGMNSDASVRRIKGSTRPVTPGEQRAAVLAALAAVDFVVPFDEDNPGRLIAAVLPDILVKGADWPEDKIVGADTVKAAGGRVVRVPLTPGISTTGIIERIRSGG